MVNIEECLKEAITSIQSDTKMTDVQQEFMHNKLLYHNVEQMLMGAPEGMICIAVGGKYLVDCIKMLMGISFETGRLVGRSEIVNETLNGMEGGE